MSELKWIQSHMTPWDLECYFNILRWLTTKRRSNHGISDVDDDDDFIHFVLETFYVMTV